MNNRSTMILFLVPIFVLCIGLVISTNSQIRFYGPSSQSVSLSEMTELYYLGGEKRKENSLEGANLLFDRALEEYDDDLTGEALLLAGRMYGENAQWEDAIEAYDLALASGKLSLMQELSVLLSKAQVYRYAKNDTLSKETYQELKRRANEDQNILDELAVLDENPSSEYHNAFYTILAASYMENVDVLINEGLYESAAEENLEFLKWFDRVHPSKQYFSADRNLGLDHSQSLVMKSHNLYMQSRLKEKAADVVHSLSNHWTIQSKDRFKYQMAEIKTSNMNPAQKIVELQNLIRSNEASIYVMEALRLLVATAKNARDYALCKEVCLEILNMDVEAKSSYPSIVESTLIDLIFIYLKEDDAENAEKYLNLVNNEYPENSYPYETASRNGFWKWVDEIKEEQQR